MPARGRSKSKTVPAPAGTVRPRTLLLAAAICLAGFLFAARGANVAYWSQTSPGYVPPTNDVRDALAIWPPDVATNLTVFINLSSTPEMTRRVRDTVRHAMRVWESAAALRFVEVTNEAQARLVIFVNYNPGAGHYHGGGGAWPPVRETNGTLRTSYLSLGYGGDPDAAESWCDDSWVWTAVHELGHALGLWHEFNRPDRDDYLRMLYASPPSVFLPINEIEMGFTADAPFDYASVMMYHWADSDRNPQYRLVLPGPDLEPAPTVSFYQRNGLSAGDLQIIRWLYGDPLYRHPLSHQSPVPDANVLPTLFSQGWSAATNKDTAIYGSGGSVVFEADYGLYDFWVNGGNPPRLEKPLPAGNFEFSADVEIKYLPPGTYAGLFIVFGPQDWITFGPCEYPRRVVSQRTGQNQSEPLMADSNRYRLRAAFTNGTLRFSCFYGGEEHTVPLFQGLPSPTHVAFGIKSWGSGEYGCRHVQFRNLSLRTLDAKTVPAP